MQQPPEPLSVHPQQQLSSKVLPASQKADVLTALTTGILFGLSLFLSPIFLAIPSFATAPALIIVGLYMLSNITNIDFADMSEAIPCYICIIAMPFFYSISEGIALGIIAYVVLNLVTGKAKEKKLNLLLYILAIIFIIKECSSLFF